MINLTTKSTNTAQKNRALDIRTERGHHIYNELTIFYPSLEYGPQASPEDIYAEGYTHVILSDTRVYSCITDKYIIKGEEQMNDYNNSCLPHEDTPLFTKSQIKKASDFLWKYAIDHQEYMPDENQYEPEWAAYEAGELLHDYINGQPIELVDIQYAMELYTTLQQPTDYRETAEDTGTVKYTAEGLYDYGYNPIDEDEDEDDIPF